MCLTEDVGDGIGEVVFPISEYDSDLGPSSRKNVAPNHQVTPRAYWWDTVLFLSVYT